eukprot:Seg1416.9 transcript_id=Seg1416.9/GoldUCD/mRNA.D3Y31 product="PiggyBac transposable element-derived protein 4" protein_id=Seg1416.9/GoldUCD/D3Y31
MHVPPRDVAIDEAMIAFEGRLGFRQYMPAKPTKYGIKVWQLSVSENGYCSNLSIYLGKPLQGKKETDLVKKVVLDMAKDLEGEYNHLYFDNYFNSVSLLEELLDKKLYGCGTMRSNRSGLPAELRPKTKNNNQNNLKKTTKEELKQSGDSAVIQKGAVTALAWLEKPKRKPVLIACTNSSSDCAAASVHQKLRKIKKQPKTMRFTLHKRLIGLPDPLDSLFDADVARLQCSPKYGDMVIGQVGVGSYSYNHSVLVVRDAKTLQTYKAGLEKQKRAEMEAARTASVCIFLMLCLSQVAWMYPAQNSFDALDGLDDLENDVEDISDPRFDDVTDNRRMTTKNSDIADNEQQQQSEDDDDDDDEANEANYVQDEDKDRENSAEDENEDFSEDNDDSNERDDEQEDDDDDDPVEPVPTGKYASCERGMCELNVSPVGCYQDKHKTPRPLNLLLDSHRDATSHAYHGEMLNWKKFDSSIRKLLCDCVRIARAKKHTHIGLQHYGECWSSKTAAKDFAIDGKSDQCVNGTYKPCKKGEFCIGKEKTNYIYKIGKSLA